MNNSRELILQRIRSALKNTPAGTAPARTISRDYRQTGDLDAGELLALFDRRVSEYKAETVVIGEDEIAGKIAETCRKEKIKKLVLPPGFDKKRLPEQDFSIRLLEDEPVPLTHEKLNNSDAVLTDCFLGVAQTGTIILNAGEGQGRRALTLLPDCHICIVESRRIVELIPEAVRKLGPVVAKTGNPVTMISGPSATSDIELTRVEGVHGPRKLYVLIVRDDSDAGDQTGK